MRRSVHSNQANGVRPSSIRRVALWARDRVTAYALPPGPLVHTTTNARAIWAIQETKNKYYRVGCWVHKSIISASLLVAPCLSISPSDGTRARSAIRVVMAVACESDNSVFEAGGRSKARDTETSDDEGLRDALQILSIC
jgi:hypothetical protein